jgi:hypothetical protein
MYGVGLTQAPAPIKGRQDCNLEVGNEIKIRLTKNKLARVSSML